MRETPALAFRTVPGFLPVYRAAAWIGALQGWRRYGAALLLGALAAAALPPVDLTPVLLISFTCLVWLLDGNRTPWGAFWLGWSFGFGFFVAGLYWIAFAMLVDIERFWWLVPFAAMGLPAVLAVFTGAALLFCHWVGARGIARILVLAVAWSAAEWVRGHVFTGFPWNLVGYAWSGGFPGATAVLQSAALFGIYGLSLLTVLAAALPAAVADPVVGRRPLLRLLPLGAMLGLVAALAAGGAARLSNGPAATTPDVRLRLVQPSIPQTLKWDPKAAASNFRRFLTLSTSPAPKAPTVVIWPEASVPWALNRNPGVRKAVASVAPPGGLVITGGPRLGSGSEPQIWNSLYAIDDDGSVAGTFDKFHLVPFGEYVPFRGILPIEKITPGIGDFSAGPGPRTLTLPGLPPVGPLICYGVVFPGQVIDEVHRPAWLLNLTNDAWFGFSSGPFQHFAMARTRAVEEGVPLVQAANNGISAIIDPYGRVTARLGLDDIGVVDGKLPRPLSPTPFAQYGNWTFAAMWAALAALGLALRRRT